MIKRPAAIFAALLAALAFGVSYALSADGGSSKSAGFQLPGSAAKPLKVSAASELQTGELKPVGAIPGLSGLPAVKAKAKAKPAPAPAPAPVRGAPVRRRSTPAPAPVVRTPAPAPAPAPKPAPEARAAGPPPELRRLRMSGRVTDPDRPVLEIGQHFADYRIEELAGRQSGVGRVFVATHLESERHLEFPPWPVALKVFTPPDGQEAEFRARFEPAAKLQAALHDPNVVSVYEYGTEPLPFMSMTLFRGPNLADLIASRELDEPVLLPIIESVAAALDGGIEHGLRYRRLHPGGVLVATDSQRAFLADFGVGRATSLDDLLENETLGPFVDYASPEEVRGSEVTGASNVYNLAAIVFECLTGEPPFPHQEGEQALQARLEGEPRKLRRLRPDLPHGLESVLARALDTEPGRRPASPGLLATAIKRAYPKRRRRAPRLRTTTTLARPPALPAAVPAAEAPTVVPEREPAVAAAAEPTVAPEPVSRTRRRPRARRCGPGASAGGPDRFPPRCCCRRRCSWPAPPCWARSWRLARRQSPRPRRPSGCQPGPRACASPRVGAGFRPRRRSRASRSLPDPDWRRARGPSRPTHGARS